MGRWLALVPSSRLASKGQGEQVTLPGLKIMDLNNCQFPKTGCPGMIRIVKYDYSIPK